MTETPAFPLPARYLPVARLGRGGGGEVWAVRDRLTGEELALKALADDAGENEVMALVREAVTLNGLEGVGVPRVLAFGSLPGSRRPFLVRELVAGRSLEEVLADDGEWLRPLAGAADQLTLLHRAGLLHGDIKPANVIVGPDGTGTLVDLGLSAPWREGGARPRGLTPRFAAPELLAGEPLTVRAEVYALGATLGYALGKRGDELAPDLRKALAAIAKRATQEEPQARQPSVDELASALRSAAGIETRAFEEGAAWPVLGFDSPAQTLAAEVGRLLPGEALAVVGPSRSGRSTLVRRLAWTLGVSATPIVALEPPRESGVTTAEEMIATELGSRGGEDQPATGLVVVIDDFEAFDEGARARLRRAAEHGARIVAVIDDTDAARAAVQAVAPKGMRVFEVPPLDDASASELLRRAIPSLPDKLAAHLLACVERRPGRLRSFVRRLGRGAVTSTDDVDAILATPSGKSAPSRSRSRAELRAELARALDTGRFDAAAELEAELGPPTSKDEAVEHAIARSRILAARGDADGAGAALDAASADAKSGGLARAWKSARARVCMRAGDFTRAASLAAEAASDDDAISADALAVRGIALSFLGDDAAIATLERARAVARKLGDARLEAVALGSLGIALQRGGRARDAKAAYESALAAAEKAHDAWTIASTRLNLAGLAKDDGDLAAALAHLEAVVDLGRRAGGQVAVQQALFNLANLDLYLGRYARAKASIERLAEQRDRLAPPSRAQLLGLQAELATRLGDVDRGARFYELCADAYDAVARPLDAAESRLEGILARAFSTSDSALTIDVSVLERELRELRARLGEAGFGKHEALANIVEGTLALARGDEPRARTLLDAAVEGAQQSGQREWAWRALDVRAKLAAAQGAAALARRDTEAALAMLEETAAKLPRDLREVFWDDPRRRNLRQAHTATLPANAATSFGRALTPPRFESGRGTSTAMSMSRSASLTSIGAPMPAEDRLVRIFEITRDLAREHDLDRLLQRVVDHAIGLVSAERGLVVLADESGNVVAHTARSSKGEESHANFSRSVAESVIKDGEPVIATSARDDERLAKAVSVHQLMIQSIACVPIKGAVPAERTIGALYLETRLRPGVRFREELPTLAAFADQAAIAIENARLIDENRKRAEELAEANLELEAAKEKLSELLGRRTEQLANVRRDLKEARAQLRSHFGYAGLVGTSAAMRKLYAVIERVKDTDVPVLVTGESGTGKEVVAKAVHVAGPRGKQPFLGVNCGAIPENLLESELFGHVRGAFTGADRDRKGLFREAENGTILLDEIGEMPLKMQAGLLRVLQEKTVRPVGGIKEEPCAARVIAATNRALEQMVSEGRFREDLFYRLHVVELRVPPLRERAEDIPALVDHFLGLFAARHKRERKTVSRDAVRRLQAFDWPGNVRQLEHVLLNAWLLAETPEIDAEDLDLPTSSLRASSPGTASPTGVEPRAVATTPSGPPAARPRTHEEHRENEKERILAALTRCNWNRVQAAKALGIPRRTFYRRLKDYGIV